MKKKINIYQKFQNRSLEQFLFSWLPVILWAAIIYFFSSNPDPYKFLPESWRYLIPIREVSDSSLAEWIGQFLHFVEFAVLAFLVARAVHKTKPDYPGITLLVVILAMSYALSDEIHQLFVPGRAFQVIDLFIDFLGVVAGLLISKIKN